MPIEPARREPVQGTGILPAMRRLARRTTQGWRPRTTATLPRRGAAARLHVVQADTRPFVIHAHSRSLAYNPHDDTEETMRSLNGGSLGRTWDYWAASAIINRLKCSILGCTHHVLPIRPEDHRDRHVTWGKIRVLLDFMQVHPEAELVAFLDSDAFIRDEVSFLALTDALLAAPGRHGVLSRDPLMPKNTFINTGCMILKNTDFSRGFLQWVWNDVEEHPQYCRDWPHEQYSASQFVRSHLEAFYVCKTAVLNTPCGDIVRHAWWKHQFAEVVEDEFKSTVAKCHCPDLATSLPAAPPAAFDLAALLDD